MPSAPWKHRGVVLPLLCVLGWALEASAQEHTAAAEPEATAEVTDGGQPVAGPSRDPAAVHETFVIGTSGTSSGSAQRASSQVRAGDLARRLPRSTPDALRFEPGVFVQQSSAGQGSAFLRGLTGQQTVILFDGVRLNNSTYRQGPNQYLFTVDPGSVAGLEVFRGGASTLFGSDALGGAILVQPLEPAADAAPGVRPSAFWRAATADREHGGRFQIEATGLSGLAFIGGVGARNVGLLESAGSVLGPENGRPPEVPRFAPDGRTQLGTGFAELTGDARLEYRLSERQKLTVAGYLYRQYDSPRTDQCPPPGARYDECLRYDEQARTLLLGSWSADLGRWAAPLRATVSWQRQHELRNQNRPASSVSSLGRDDVDTVTVGLRGETRPWQARPWLALGLVYGAETGHDRITSRAWLRFTDVGVTLARSRGQYLDGSTSLSGGAFAEATARLPGQLALRGGARASWVAASAPEDVESGSKRVARSWAPIVGSCGLEWAPLEGLSVRLNFDRSFRAPNLDDLTSRQQTGPGFQFENSALEPERATTAELGAQLRTRWLSAEFWAFDTRLEAAVGKAPRAASDCPPETPQCQNSWFRYQLVNARALSEVRGLEASARARLPGDLVARATAGWAWGEGPNLAAPPADESALHAPRVPLSRIPPSHGTVELRWLAGAGVTLEAVLRWAGAQRRLAVADRSDPRIPQGGTPGFAVVDVRASYRFGGAVAVSAALENVFDSAYRYHGSSVNGPARGGSVAVELSPF